MDGLLRTFSPFWSDSVARLGWLELVHYDEEAKVPLQCQLALNVPVGNYKATFSREQRHIVGSVVVPTLSSSCWFCMYSASRLDGGSRPSPSGHVSSPVGLLQLHQQLGRATM